MGWLKRYGDRDAHPSEKGFLELAKRQVDLPLRDVTVCFRDLVSADMDWADSRKVRFRKQASRVKVASLVLAAISTVILGVKEIGDSRASIALPLVALVTMLGAMDGFFNWRSRWVLMEETLYRLNKLRDKMDYYLVVTPSGEIARKQLDLFFKEQQVIWNDVSRRWLQLPRDDVPYQGGNFPESRDTV